MIKDDIYGIQYIKDLTTCEIYTLTHPIEGKYYAYKLNKGDTIIVPEKQIFNVFHNIYNIFRPIKREKHIIWYKPPTWFRWYWVLEVINEHKSNSK